MRGLLCDSRTIKTLSDFRTPSYFVLKTYPCRTPRWETCSQRIWNGGHPGLSTDRPVPSRDRLAYFARAFRVKVRMVSSSGRATRRASGEVGLAGEEGVLGAHGGYGSAGEAAVEYEDSDFGAGLCQFLFEELEGQSGVAGVVGVGVGVRAASAAPEVLPRRSAIRVGRGGVPGPLFRRPSASARWAPYSSQPWKSSMQNPHFAGAASETFAPYGPLGVSWPVPLLLGTLFWTPWAGGVELIDLPSSRRAVRPGAARTSRSHKSCKRA